MDVRKFLAQKKEAESLPSPHPAKADDLSYDLALKLADDSLPFENGETYAATMKAIKRRARDNVQLFVNQLFALPKEEGEFLLPPRQEVLPRAFAPPKPKHETKWEKHKKEKCIKKRERTDGKVFDETSGRWLPRYGMRAKRIEDDWVLEDKYTAQYAEGEDPFIKAKQERKGKVAENEKLRRGNQIQAARDAKAERKAEILKTLTAAKRGTASMGRFDAKVRDEPTQKEHKRSHYGSNTAKADAEREKLRKLASKMLKKSQRT